MSWRGWLPLGLLVFGFFAFASCPTVCVIIPETVIIERIPRPVPDPASETAVIKAFLSYGFHVVDQAQVKFLRITEPETMEKAYNGGVSTVRQLSDHLVVDVLVLDGVASTETVFKALPTGWPSGGGRAGCRGCHRPNPLRSRGGGCISGVGIG